jgi:hypothetical protein
VYSRGRGRVSRRGRDTDIGRVPWAVAFGVLPMVTLPFVNGECGWYVEVCKGLYRGAGYCGYSMRLNCEEALAVGCMTTATEQGRWKF